MALVLGRKKHEGVKIGAAYVYVSDIRKTGVRLSISAPEDCRIMRTELLDTDDSAAKGERTTEEAA